MQGQKRAGTRTVASAPAKITWAEVVEPLDPYKSNLERQYAAFLEERSLAGEIAWWGYEPCSWQLAPKTFYRPDFLFIENKVLTFVETKGRPRPLGKAKFKIAAAKFPFFRW